LQDRGLFEEVLANSFDVLATEREGKPLPGSPF
jgi:hypothetical protein